MKRKIEGSTHLRLGVPQGDGILRFPEVLLKRWPHQCDEMHAIYILITLPVKVDMSEIGG